MTDYTKLKQLAEAIEPWKLDQAWLDTSEDESAAVVGTIDEDGRTFPVVTVDCDQYYQGQDSLPLAKFIAAANPATILQMIEEIEALKKDAGRYQWLRNQHWSDNTLIVANSVSVKLGHPAYSLDRLDSAIDKAMEEGK